MPPERRLKPGERNDERAAPACRAQRRGDPGAPPHRPALGTGAPAFEAPTSTAGVLLVLLRGDSARPHSAAPLESLRAPPDGSTRFAHVSTSPHPLDLTFTAADAQARRIDLLLSGTLLVSDPLAFLNGVGLGLVSPDVPLAGPIIASWISHTVGHRVRDHLAEHSFDDLRHKEVLPPAWWQTQLNDWLAPVGLRVSLVAVRWESADVQRAETERRRQEDLARLQSDASASGRPNCARPPPTPSMNARKPASRPTPGCRRKRRSTSCCGWRNSTTRR